jgi:vacuolar-type H+-ATPase subunit I/STV1
MEKLYKLMNDYYLRHVTVNRYLSELGKKKNELMRKISDLNSRYDIDKESIADESVSTGDRQEIIRTLEKVKKEYQDVEKLQEAIEKAKELELQNLAEEIGNEFENYMTHVYEEFDESCMDLLKIKLAYLARLYEFRKQFDELAKLVQEIEKIHTQSGISFRPERLNHLSALALSSASSRDKQPMYRIYDNEFNDIFIEGEIRKYPQVYAFYKYGKVFRSQEEAMTYIEEEGR